MRDGDADQERDGDEPGRSCACGSWIEHYYVHGGSGDACVVCRSRRIVGGHGWVEQSLLWVIQWRELGQHIVPLCGRCNMQGGWMDAVLDFDLISANTQQMRCALRAMLERCVAARDRAG